MLIEKYRDRKIVLLFLRIGEDVVGGFLYPGLVLQGVHLLNIDNVPHLLGLLRSSSTTWLCCSICSIFDAKA